MSIDSTKNWIRKAENDFKIGKDEIITEEPATDAICFPMQQCVEKYLKAFLIFNGKEIRKTHDIAELIEKCCEIDPSFEDLYNINADELTSYAVEIRYPEEFYFPSLQEAEKAIEIAEKVKFFILKKLRNSGLEI